jgi:hypothetical protein
MGPVKVELQDVTQLVINWREGDEDRPGQSIPLLYEELRQLMLGYLHRDRSAKLWLFRALNDAA